MVSGAGGQLKTMQAVSQVQSSGAGGGVKMVMVTSGQLAQVCSLLTHAIPVNIIDWDSDFFPALSLRLSFTV